ncbi:ATP-binding cassette domain-containing protein [Chryseobacterium geocarposphaerae]|uniref:ABC-type lipopolysaccharide export system ATPase subunit n=1 Tax=Chryseobacterium geocarposphaerae TaxID=1416776 RepID=A0A2M9C9S2_9FLAO|nr:ATP-binding cassette domain-containing protein [Chryseobacterium geocarposphaerae]PJJ67598.1 ABC-type lipopolysaccharide export system ATPase subunit [Chryseobacterium geocarposphaerae]
MSKLHIDSLIKSFNGKTILRDIYLGCETGKIAGILGRNGSGKSTLLKIIFGTMKGDHQYIRVDDKVLQNQWDRKNKIAYLPQHFFLPKGINIKNLIPIFCNKENSEKLTELDLIKPLLNETSRNLSGGEKKIVEALLIIFSESKFILLDEPFNGLSPKMTSEVQKLIKEQSKEKGIIISDHRYQEVLDISDEIYLLSDSHLKSIKDLKELQRYNYLPKNI